MLRALPALHFGRSSPLVSSILAPVQAAHLRWLEPSISATFEGSLRPVLFPSERLADADAWRTNLQLMVWLRSAYLRSHPNTQRLLPAARSALEKRPDAPISMRDARSLFGLEHPADDARPKQPALARAKARKAGYRESYDKDVSSMEFGGLLEEAGALVARRGPLSAWCEEVGAYELVTSELVEAIASYVDERLPTIDREGSATSALLASDAAESAAAAAAAEAAAAADAEAGAEAPRTSGAPARIVEVGAGNGELSHYLRQALRARGTDAVVIASDRAPWPRTVGRVEALDYREALKTYRPHLVLCSWMPMGVDWTRAFRECGSVGEYLLLGEVYDGAVGHNWETWGNPAFADDEKPATPPHARDGWELAEVPSVSRWMLSRYVSDVADCECGSAAVAFRRGRS